MKLYYSSFVIALLLLASPVEMRELQQQQVRTTEDSGRCLIVMDPNGCNLLSCKQRRLQQKNGNGVCLSNLKEGYQCICYINC
ncbi:hypothetical protein Pint_11062 [Pistacia integerrima]|uniref:Uncharacterized protein n=1 Tax=Pistacia integerrima TaxID=434235 RepID=A0ACC0XKV1_9ROSI|nr:hypothetical protein Pint_11062 [Pistacia integerrima]